MRYVAAYLLASLGKGEVSNGDLTAILTSVGIDADAAKIQIIMDQMKGKSVDEVLAEGLTKLTSVPSGGAPAGGAAAAGGAAPAEAAKEEEKKAESEDEESDDDMGFGLFD